MERNRLASLWYLLCVGLSSIGHAQQPDGGVRRALLSLDEFKYEGWTQSHEIATRVGAGRRQTDETRRARKVGGVSVIRVFRSDPESREEFSSCITPFATSADAQSFYPKVPSRIIYKPFGRYELLSKESYYDDLIEELPHALVHQVLYEISNGPRFSTLVGGAVGRYTVDLRFHRPDAPWPPEEMRAFGTAQALKMRNMLSIDAAV